VSALTQFCCKFCHRVVGEAETVAEWPGAQAARRGHESRCTAQEGFHAAVKYAFAAPHEYEAGCQCEACKGHRAEVAEAERVARLDEHLEPIPLVTGALVLPTTTEAEPRVFIPGPDQGGPIGGGMWIGGTQRLVTGVELGLKPAGGRRLSSQEILDEVNLRG
jgi:hypothetical protein